MIENTFIFIPIRADFIEKALETLYKYTSGNFKVIVMDQTLNPIYDKIKDKVTLYIRPNRNLGFAKAANEGMLHAVRWGSEYVTLCNDDIEFINEKWWQGILDTFHMESEKEILAVNPESPRIPLWGYGRDHGEYVDIIEYEDRFSPEKYDLLLSGEFKFLEEKYPDLPDSFPRKKVGVTDAIATWCTTFKKDFFDKVGYYEELYYPGGGEDYDLCARAYSQGYRMLGATKSWVWHHWGASKDEPQDKAIIDEKYRWNNQHVHWPPELNEGHGLDVWGHYTNAKGEKVPLKRACPATIVEI